MVTPFSSMSLRFKIVFGMLLSLLPMLAIVLITYYSETNATLNNMKRVMVLANQHGAEDINRYIRGRAGIFTQWAEDDVFGMAIEFNMNSELTDHFNTLLENQEGFSLLMVADLKGRIITAAGKKIDGKPARQLEGMTLEKLHAPDNNGEKSVTFFKGRLVDGMGLPSFHSYCFSLKTRDSNGRHNGYFFAYMDWSAIQERCRDLLASIRKSGFHRAEAVVLNVSASTIIGHPDKEMIDQTVQINESLKSWLRRTRGEGVEKFEFKGEKNYITAVPVLNVSKLFNSRAFQTPEVPYLCLSLFVPENEVMLGVRKTLVSSVGIAAAGSFIIILLAFFFLSDIKDKFQRFLDVFEDMSKGNIKDKIVISGNDEFARASESFNRLVVYLEEVVEVCEGVSEGNFEKRKALSGANDLLGNAVNRMTFRLNEMAESQAREDWMKTGQAELVNAMRGEQDPPTLARTTISFLARYLNAQIGALYLADEDHCLCLSGSFAFQKRKNISTRFQTGEGIVGQAAMEKDYIMISNVPDDYLVISSGLGEAKPTHILAMPFLYNDEVKGVLELGTYEDFSEQHIDFLQTIAENLAINFTTSLSRLKMKELLDMTSRQAEELKKQQEELEASNAELEEQTARLQASESRLKQQQEELKLQQEELRAANEKLEEKNRDLEEKKESIEEQNRELEAARVTIEKKAEDLEAANRYKSQFLANMSHELRTPLNSILLLSNLLSKNRNGSLTQKEQEYCQTIHRSGNDLLSLINDVLDLSKMEAGKMNVNLEEIELDDFIGYLKRNFDPQAEEKGLLIHTVLGKDLPGHIYSDRQRLDQILKNLISNALKFTENGSITLLVEQTSDDTVFNHLTIPPADTVSIRVRDTGIGIAKEKQQSIFEAFTQEDGTTARKYGGTGLGLSISSQLAGLLEAEIFLESSQGKGSTFTLCLPKRHSGLTESPGGTVPKDEEGKKKEKERKGNVPEIKKGLPEYRPGGLGSIMDDRRNLSEAHRSILIVEDDPKFARVLFDMAHERHFQCLVAEDGETGLQHAEQYQPSAIILDVHLPRIDGWEVMARLARNKKTRHIPVHFISGSEQAHSIEKYGAIGYLKKPVSMKALEEAFQKIETEVARGIKEVLLIGSREKPVDTILDLLQSEDIRISRSESLGESLGLLEQHRFDCIILMFDPDKKYDDAFIRKIKEKSQAVSAPIIVYAVHGVSDHEKKMLSEYTDTIISESDNKAMAKLLDGVSLFLHRIEEDMPERQKHLLQTLYEKHHVLKDKKILLVDDDMRNIFAVMNILEENKMNVVVARDGKEALEKIEENSDLDLILMDIMMPEMDGYEAMQHIRRDQRFKNLPIIALTAKSMRGDRDKCIQSGANDYIAKPIDVDKLLSLLRVWLYS